MLAYHKLHYKFLVKSLEVTGKLAASLNTLNYSPRFNFWRLQEVQVLRGDPLDGYGSVYRSFQILHNI